VRRSVLAFTIALLSTAVSAQEVEPRRWGHLPMGVNFAGAGYVRTNGDILLDPVLLLEDVKLEVDTYAVKYIRTFELLNRSARVDMTYAYQQATWTGLLDGQPASAYRSGWADPIVRFSVNLLGAPPLKAAEFARYRSQADKETIVGVGLAVHLPLGEYLEDKLLNLGTNRFTIRPQFGAVHKRGRWSFEATGGVWFYTDNNDFVDGGRREQDPLYAIQTHVVGTFRPGLWVSASGAYGYGAESTVNGTASGDQSDDVFFAISVGYPITRKVGGSVGYVGSRTQHSVGLDSDSFNVGISGFW
jgi:hypothetical protein